MPPRDPRLRPALERALPADDVPGPTTVLDWPERVLVLFGDGEWHPVNVLTRGADRQGREVIGVDWFAGGETWTESYVADRTRMREA